MKTDLYVQIPKPCHENWDNMTAANKGRFCSSCNKEVVDFSLLTDVEVLNFFKRSTGNTCGRFSTYQLERPLQETKIEKKKSWKWLLASITSLVMISRSNAQKKEECTALVGKVKITQPRKPDAKTDSVLKNLVLGGAFIRPHVIKPQPVIKPIINDLKGEVVITAGRKVMIDGYVDDENDNAIAGAAVSVGGQVKGYTDNDGYFSVTTLAMPGKLSISFTSVGFTDESSVIDAPKDIATLFITMKPKAQELPGVTVTGYGTKGIQCRMGDYTSYMSVEKKDTLTSFIRKITGDPFLRIYPNPVAKNTTFNISIKEAGNYQVQLLDNNSRLLLSEEKSTTSKQQVINISLPENIAAGIYYARLINMQTKKTFIDKLIVQ